MKKIYGVSLLVAGFLMLSLTSCKKDSGDDGSVDGSIDANVLAPGKSKVSCNITGSSSSSYSSYDLTSVVNKSGGTILIQTTSQPTSSMQMHTFVIYLPANITTGTYKIEQITGGVFTYGYNEGSTTKAWAAVDADTEFTVKITKADNAVIEGTFSGEMENEDDQTYVHISNGAFGAKF